MRLDELTVGRVAPNVSTIDKTSPWIRKHMDIAADRTKEINSAKSVREKFEIIYALSKKTAAIKLKLGNFSGNSIQSYDPSTGDIIFKSKVTHAGADLYITNIDSFEYEGRERSATNTAKTYKFKETVPAKHVGVMPGKTPSIKSKGQSNNDVFSAWG
jgi:hypothetical protein